MTYNADQLAQLPDLLSQPRFETYLNRCGQNTSLALDLYKWNMRVSAALIIPIHLGEIAVRNGISEAISEKFGATWYNNEGFRLTLPDLDPPAFNPRRELKPVSERENTEGKVISELKLAFWETMLTNRFQRRIWQSQVNIRFPNMSSGWNTKKKRQSLHSAVIRMRKVRNRVAHHEPVFSRDLTRDLNEIRHLVSSRSLEGGRWMSELETVSEIVTEKPALP